MKTAEQLDDFIARKFDPSTEALASRFGLALSELAETGIQKYRMRYILAKITQFVDVQALGSEGAEQDLATYVSNKRVDVEHILPQTPTPEIQESFDRPDRYDEFVHRLGNLTLLEKAINASIGNRSFVHKRDKYAESKFLVTKTIGKEVKIGTNTAIDRAVRDLQSFEEWDSKAIQRRQAMLTNLAHRVWDVPEVEQGERE